MRVNEVNQLLFEGDKVRDRMDNSVRVVSGFVIHDEENASVQFEDGGVMDVNEISFDDISIS